MTRSIAHSLKITTSPLLPGLALCGVLTGFAFALQWAEELLFGKAWLEALVLAILGGTCLRSLWAPGARYHAGICFSARTLLEFSVVLMGASISAAKIVSLGPFLVPGIAAVVLLAILVSFGLGLLLGLPARMALLVACGNAICGNSAIAAVAPVIRADAKDVATSIAFTAVLGVLVVLGLPLLGVAAGMSGFSFGIFAGMTVYAVPQVLAATAPLGTLAVQTGTVVKLVRVLMLGPVCFVLSLLARRLPPEEPDGSDVSAGPALQPSGSVPLVPWFIPGFLGMMLCCSAGLIPLWLNAPLTQGATILTVFSMAALGLGVDARSVSRAGGRVTLTVVLSLVGLGVLSMLLLDLVPLT
ncbi:putative sulfate exporter family transporter [Acetobacter farinalis]|uniref:Sulfate exporter family transporter n=1 Tax=Acetobacter farinalis TaxID=1260984 RepID=A0ABT3Q3I1_9PROT|nr:putative sulfate exporter family transporter [Acetobacter farinalis]MCX2559853.1 putative sulfate exporter family transporter [Acetobacter farinalis]NHO28514.1 putative sulfate exporter family transporter [Acetobacter farinalis]